MAEHAGRSSWRRTWLLPLLAIVGRRMAVYIALYPLHLALAGLALAFIAIKAGTGDDDWIFWLSYAWITLQVVVWRRLFLPSALALAFVALQATQADRDAIFWLCFTWLCLMVLGGGVLIRATRTRRRRARNRAEADTGGGFENIFASAFGQQGFTWPEGAGASAQTDEGDQHDEPIEGTAREVDSDLVGELERLAALHRSGELTDQEYADAKRKLTS